MIQLVPLGSMLAEVAAARDKAGDVKRNKEGEKRKRRQVKQGKNDDDGVQGDGGAQSQAQTE
jgi:hypothetical protein